MTSGKRGSNSPQKFICGYCEGEFERTVTPSAPQFRFCSPTCRNKARTRPLIPCPVCGTLFSDRVNDSAGKRKECCGSACAAKNKRTQNDDLCSDEDITKYIQETYPGRGAEPAMEKFGLLKSFVQRLAYKHGIKMSKAAYRKRVHAAARDYMTENNPMNNKETVKKVQAYWEKHPEKRREIQLRATRTNQRNNPSGLEKKCWAVLDSLGVEYEKQAIIKKGFVVDIRIEQLIIQLDGDYWHGHPVKFPEPTERQIAQQKRDAAQDKYLVACGYAVVRVWECDFCKETIADILEYYNSL